MKEEKQFIIRKYVIAKSAIEALKKEKKREADDCWVDENWQREYVVRGFNKK
jgi:hypothetical protein